MEAGVKIKIVKNSTHKSEAEFVARTIEQMMGGLRFFSMDSSITEGNKEGEIDSLSDFVVLCRVKDQMEALEKAFMDHSIPYQVVGEEPFFKQEPICSIIDLLKFSCNPKNTILKDKLIEKQIITPLEMGSLKNIVSEGKPVKEILENLLANYFSELKTASHDDATQEKNNQKFLQGVEKREAGKLGSWEAEKTGRVEGENCQLSIVNGLLSMEMVETTANEKLLQGGMRKAHSAGRKANNRSGAERQAPSAMRLPPGFKRLLDLVGDFGNDLEGFLRFTVLGTAVDTYRPGLEQVTLMTLHGAKGLEFKAVFIVGCEEGLLPYSLFKSQTSDPEEERRLLYVGMTRAKKFLFLSHAERRFLLGREYQLKRSLFLDRIERELIELSQQEKKKAKEPIQRTLFDLK
jgi:superfamily I DNA/RNA helicase